MGKITKITKRRATRTRRNSVNPNSSALSANYIDGLIPLLVRINRRINNGDKIDGLIAKIQAHVSRFPTEAEADAANWNNKTSAADIKKKFEDMQKKKFKSVFKAAVAV